MGVRLEPIDEYMHELGPEPNFNESMYFSVFDPVERVGGWFRCGNRANEGHAEMTVCLYLPDGRVAFMYKRPEIANNDAFAAGGIRFDVVTPFERLDVSYAGDVVLLEEPLQMADPKSAFAVNPHTECEVRLEYSGISAMYGGEPDTPQESPGEEFATGHYDQLVSASGTIRVGPCQWAVEGFGLRDHSWGPRYWQAPWYYRWLTASFGPDFGFMGSRMAKRDSDGLRGGFVWEGGQVHECVDLRLATEWTGAGRYHDRLSVTLRTGEREWKVRGKVLGLIPLRSRRADADGTMLVTRISEGLTEWTLEDGRVGYGMSEYLDQIIDGSPVGLAE